MTAISVVIPTRDRATSLHRCLDALTVQSVPAEEFEVVVVDDGSSDETPRLLDGYAAPFSLRAVNQANAGAGAARNRGIELAAGEFCLFLDDDIVADQELVAEHLRVQREAGGVVGVGRLRLVMESRGGLATHFARWWERHYAAFETGAAEPDFWACFSGNLSAPTAALRRIGGFDESLTRTEDVEVGYRLAGAGLRIAHIGGASAEQRHSKGFRSMVRDYDRAGESAVALWRRHPELMRYPPLGDFAQGGTRAVMLRRVLLALRAPTWPLALVDPFLARRAPERVYAFLQLYCFWRGLRRAVDSRDTWLRLTRGTVILMYHAVAGRGERASRYAIPIRRLRRQLDWLRWRRRPVLSLGEYASCRAENRLPPPRAIVLTFDDGYAELTRVAELLRRRAMPATVFVVAGELGGTNAWDGSGSIAGRRLLSADAIRVLAAGGFEIGAHSMSHPRLPELPLAEVEREVRESKDRLERELGLPVLHFAYPYGETSPSVEGVVRAAGFSCACGVLPGANGPAVPIHGLRRLEVWGTRTLPRFVADVWLGRHVGAPREDVDAGSAEAEVAGPWPAIARRR